MSLCGGGHGQVLKVLRTPHCVPLRVDNKPPISVSYRWIATAIETHDPDWDEAETYALLPVMVRPSDVLTYSVHRNGPALLRESHDIIVPGDYGFYATGMFIY